MLQFGKSYVPSATLPVPEILQYKSNPPLTVFSSGIEKIITVFYIDFLDKTQYQSIIKSAKTNAKIVKGKKKYRFLDKYQRQSPINQATVVFIFAKKVDSKLQGNLFETVTKENGDDNDTSLLPCVVDLETRFCTFDSMFIPNIAFQYPIKNRAIKLIRKFLFNNRFTFSYSPETVEFYDDLNAEQSLWEFFRKTRKELKTDEKQIRKRFEKMTHGEIYIEEDFLFLKWKECGIQLSTLFDSKTKTVEIEGIECWCYPKSNKISKTIVKDLKKHINDYFAYKGYSVKYV